MKRRFAVFLLASLAVHSSAALLLLKHTTDSTRLLFARGDTIAARLVSRRSSNEVDAHQQQGPQGNAPSGNKSRFESDAVALINQKMQSRIEYPALARRYGWEGRVVIEAQIDPEGKCVHANVAMSSGREILDNAALAAVRAYAFPKGGATEKARFGFRFELTRNQD